MLSDSQRIGIGFCVLGFMLYATGVILLLDRALLTLGNLSFLCGLFLVLGVYKTLSFFFFKKRKWRASGCYFLGILLIMGGYKLIGLPLQVYGTLLLFSSFLPQVLASIQMSPVGWLLQLPGIKQITKWLLDREKQLPV